MVLAGMEFWNEDHIYRIPYHGMERNSTFTIPYHGMERYWNGWIMIPYHGME